MADIVLRLRIDDKDYDAKIINADQQLKKLRGSTDAVVKSTGMMGSVGKREIGIFASQLLYSANLTGRLGSQLSNVASGLLTGGAAGAAFAGAAGLINVLTSKTNEWNAALKTSAQNLLEVKSGLEGVKFAVTPEEMGKILNDFQNLSDITKEIMNVFTGGSVQTEIAMWFANILGALPESIQANEAILEVLKTQQTQLQANLLIANAYAKSLGYENYEAYKKFLEAEKEKKKAEEEGIKLAERRLELQKDVAIRIKTGQEKEIAQLTEKYNEERTLAGSNHQLLLQLEDQYQQNLLQIRLKYKRLELKEDAEFHQKVKKAEEEKFKATQDRYAREMGGAIDMLELEKNISEMKKAIWETENEFRIESQLQMLAFLQGSFAQHTAVFKAAAAAETLISTYQGAQQAFTSLSTIPIVGPALGLVMAGLVTAGGLARVASILSTEVPGYAQGGIVVGENGPEVIAPMQDYAEGQSLLVAKTIAAVQGRLGSTGYGTVEKKLDQVILAFQNKQFRIKYNELGTANEKTNAVISEMEF